MPTVITKKVGATNTPTTMDYSTLQAAEDAITADLVAADEQWVIEAYDQGSFTAGVTVSGHTTDATRNIIFRTHAGSTAGFHQKTGVRTTALFFNESGGVTLTGTSTYFLFDDAYTTLSGFQVKTTAGYFRTFYSGAGQNISVENCILDAGSASVQNVYMGTSTTTRFINNLVIQRDDNTAVLSAGLVEFNTIVRVGLPGTGTAIVSDGNNAVIKNNAVFGFATFVSGTGAGGSGWNATDLASAPGTNNVTSLTASNEFENTSTDYRAKSTGNMHAGTPDATYGTVDISLFTRDTSTPWIGAWEVAAAGGSTAVRKLRRSWLTRRV